MSIPPWVAEILGSLPDPALLLGPNGRVALLNPIAEDRFGAWVVGQSYVSVLRQPAMLGPIEDAFHARTPGQARFVHSDGATQSTFTVTIKSLSTLDAMNGTCVLLTFRDMSEADASMTARRDFVANVSHELKTPLTALIGLVETLQGPARRDPKAQDRFLGMMGQELSRMNRLVTDLLSLGRVESQLRRRPRDVVDLSASIAEAIDLLRPRAAERSVVLTGDRADRALVTGDRDQLMQVIVNVLENAIKYGSAPGSVQISLDLLDHEPVLRVPCWHLTVTDDGPGIAPEHLPRLTERFYRVDGARARNDGGTGLGLAIVKHIVQRHRGRLRIASEQGQGTRVSIVIPAAP